MVGAQLFPQEKVVAAPVAEAKAKVEPKPKEVAVVEASQSQGETWCQPRVLSSRAYNWWYGQHQMFGMSLPAGFGWQHEFPSHGIPPFFQDFCDKVWKNSIGRKEAAFFQKRALPLSLLAASALGDLEVSKTSELIVHCFLDGNIAPFSDPHDWSIFLKRCPEVRNILVVYIDIGAVGADKDGQPPPSYGTLLRPTEEGRVGDRVARAARFMGTYQEFKAHCRDLPRLVRPHVALWADVPLYGFHDDDFCTRLQAR
eukprot:Skav218828  [mRNA]  locus=scaffold2959:67970:71057:+ [translate_table: standard]